MSTVQFGGLPEPCPSSGLDAYRRERELALAHDPRTRENFERYRRAMRGEAVDYLPIKLDIENVSRCNYHCSMCTVSDWVQGRRSTDLPVADFKRLLDEQYGLVEIKLQGLGEPLLQRDDLFEMIRYARDRHIWVRSTTNASLLHLNENYKKIIDSGVNELQISIDGASKAVYESIRQGGIFERVAENCTLVNSYSRQAGVRVTKMWTVVQQKNVCEMEQLVDFAAQTGFQDQAFALTLTDWGQTSWGEKNSAASVQSSLDETFLLSLVERGAAKDVRVGFWTVNDKYRSGDTATLCPWPFERAFIASDLRVVPCCYISNPDIYQIGKSIPESGGFSPIWLGDDYAAFRRGHLTGDLPNICKGCYGVRDRSVRR